ncbi:MAG: DUF1598 domain-containing protein [Planctomycetota bacterium]
MSSRAFVGALNRTLTVLAAFAVCAAVPATVVGGNYRLGSVGGVVIRNDGVVRNATIDQQAALAKMRREDYKEPGDEMERAVELRKISLTALESACRDALTANNGELPDEIKYLGGLQRVQYVFVYPEQNDIVLAGPAEAWTIDEAGNVVGETTGRPVLQLDDLLVALRTVGNARRGALSCSINPTAQGMQQLNKLLNRQRRSGVTSQNRSRLERAMKQAFGPQQVSLQGVPVHSHFARVLVAADYRMKRLAMNLDDAPLRDFPSYVELVKKDPSEARTTNPRWWMACNYEPLSRSEDGLAWELRGQGVKCLTENDIIAADGSAEAAGTTSPIAQEWADSMTEKFEQLAAREPVFAQLRNVMDWCVVAAMIDEHELTAQAGCHLPVLTGNQGDLEPEYWFAPKTVPPECSFLKTRSGWIVTTSGGVQIESFRVASQVETNNTVGQVRTRAGTPDGQTWWWN